MQRHRLQACNRQPGSSFSSRNFRLPRASFAITQGGEALSAHGHTTTTDARPPVKPQRTSTQAVEQTRKPRNGSSLAARRLGVTISNAEASNVYTIFGDAQSPMSIPPAFQVRNLRGFVGAL